MLSLSSGSSLAQWVCWPWLHGLPAVTFTKGFELFFWLITHFWIWNYTSHDHLALGLSFIKCFLYCFSWVPCLGGLFSPLPELFNDASSLDWEVCVWLPPCWSRSWLLLLAPSHVKYCEMQLLRVYVNTLFTWKLLPICNQTVLQMHTSLINGSSHYLLLWH